MSIIANDKHKIVCVNNPIIGYAYYKVGMAGITRIEAYDEAGEEAYVPWIAIYKKDFLWVRFKIPAGMEIFYEEVQDETKL